MSNGKKHIKWGMIFIIIGLFLILVNAGVLNLFRIFWAFVAIMIIWVGIRMLRKERLQKERRHFFSESDSGTVVRTSENINYSSVVGDIRIKVEPGIFTGGCISNVLGDTYVDLAAVQLTGAGQLDLNTVFGDIALRLPPGLPFKISGNSVFGTMTMPDREKHHGRDYTSPEYDSAENTLNIKISQVFGDVEIL